MQVINVRETREKLSSLLDMAAAGEEIAIVRHGKPVARLVAPQAERVQFIDRSELKASLPPVKESAAEVICNLRQEERQ
ncbi:type II toxin-antitoxin system prevent-host-death family antitoxin [Natronospirillum operosum]|uniref:Antitoxin n=1 Tax=Natronospirillum operosum TaxID=2759953 RepID=A0A4Z0WF47_9GAMM|nr:type II toxin-antitoxin system prevent-host-death family antitoxin [Natronospirillum operosum]TGG95248.1 type II toxin-antitoxin system prevent-host-death family antitoxin [Natronospirillum operosum]